MCCFGLCGTLVVVVVVVIKEQHNLRQLVVLIEEAKQWAMNLAINHMQAKV